MYCKKCGSEINENSEFCSKCGTKVKAEKKAKKETSKATRILIIVLLSLVILYFLTIVIANINNVIQQLSKGDIGIYISFGLWLFIVFLCGCGIIKNISRLRGKTLTEEQMKKNRKRNTILGLSSVVVVVLAIVVISGYSNISESKEKEQMISKIKEYQNTGYLELSDAEYQKLETSSNSEIKERLDKIENNIKLQKEYNEKYSAKLDEIYAKEIKVELYESEDSNFAYIPFNTSTGEKHAKAQVEYVTINKYSNDIYEIYYSVEMDLTVYNKYNPKDVSRGVTKKYYKIPYLHDIDDIQKINNYNDKSIQDELNNIIYGKIKEVLAFPSKDNNNYKYNFLHVQE